MAYPTRAELVAASQVAALTDLTDEQQDALRAAAITAVEEYTHQGFGGLEAGVTRMVDGNGRKRLKLPARLASLDALEVAGTGLGAADVVIEDGKYLAIPEGEAIGNYYSRAITDTPYTAAFTQGVNTVRVTGDWGWDDPPEAVVLALRYDMEDAARAQGHSLAGPVAAYAGMGVASVSQRGLSLSFRDPAVPGAQILSPRAAARLSRYVWLAEGVAV